MYSIWNTHGGQEISKGGFQEEERMKLYKKLQGIVVQGRFNGEEDGRARWRRECGEG